MLKGIVYLLRSPSRPGIYIGSTTICLSKRLSMHKANYRRWLSGRSAWCSAFQLLHEGDAQIIPLEEIQCETRAELVKREGQIQASLQCVNSNRAGREAKEWYMANREAVLKKAADRYRIAEVRQSRRDYYRKNAELFKARALARYYLKKRI